MKDNLPFSSPTHEEDSLVLKDIGSETHEKLIPPFPDSPTIWEDLFEQTSPIISNHVTPSYPSLDSSPMRNEAILPNPTMTCDEPIICHFPRSSPPRVDIMAHKNDTLEKEDNQIKPSSHITTIDTKKYPTLNHPPMCAKKQAYITPNLILPNHGLHDYPFIEINPSTKPSLKILPSKLSPWYILN